MLHKEFLKNKLPVAATGLFLALVMLVGVMPLHSLAEQAPAPVQPTAVEEGAQPPAEPEDDPQGGAADEDAPTPAQGDGEEQEGQAADSGNEGGETAPFAYAPQPEDAAAVAALVAACPTQGGEELAAFYAGLPRWEYAIDVLWLPQGWAQCEFTDEESGAVYWRLTPLPTAQALDLLPNGALGVASEEEFFEALAYIESYLGGQGTISLLQDITLAQAFEIPQDGRVTLNSYAAGNPDAAFVLFTPERIVVRGALAVQGVHITSTYLFGFDMPMEVYGQLLVEQAQLRSLQIRLYDYAQAQLNDCYITGLANKEIRDQFVIVMRGSHIQLEMNDCTVADIEVSSYNGSQPYVHVLSNGSGTSEAAVEPFRGNYSRFQLRGCTFDLTSLTTASEAVYYGYATGGELVVEDCYFTGETGVMAMGHAGASIQIIRSEFVDCRLYAVSVGSSDSDGDAMSTVTVDSSTMRGGRARAITLMGINADIVNSNIVDNNTTTQNGGGVYISGLNKQKAFEINITGSTISGNHAIAAGGGIYVENMSQAPAVVTVQNTTIDANTAGGTGSGGSYASSGFGAGIWLGKGSRLVVANSRVTNNQILYRSASVSTAGAGIHTRNHNNLVVQDTLFAGNGGQVNPRTFSAGDTPNLAMVYERNISGITGLSGEFDPEHENVAYRYAYNNVDITYLADSAAPYAQEVYEIDREVSGSIRWAGGTHGAMTITWPGGQTTTIPASEIVHEWTYPVPEGLVLEPGDHITFARDGEETTAVVLPVNAAVQKEVNLAPDREGRLAVIPGQEFSYTLTVSQQSTRALDVQLVDMLPQELEYLRSTTGHVLYPTALNPEVDAATGRVAWHLTLPGKAKGAEESEFVLTLWVRVRADADPDAVATLTNTATVAFDTGYTRQGTPGSSTIELIQSVYTVTIHHRQVNGSLVADEYMVDGANPSEHGANYGDWAVPQLLVRQHRALYYKIAGDPAGDVVYGMDEPLDMDAIDDDVTIEIYYVSSVLQVSVPSSLNFYTHNGDTGEIQSPVYRMANGSDAAVQVQFVQLHTDAYEDVRGETVVLDADGITVVERAGADYELQLGLAAGGEGNPLASLPPGDTGAGLVPNHNYSESGQPLAFGTLAGAAYTGGAGYTSGWFTITGQYTGPFRRTPMRPQVAFSFHFAIAPPASHEYG